MCLGTQTGVLASDGQSLRQARKASGPEVSWLRNPNCVLFGMEREKERPEEMRETLWNLFALTAYLHIQGHLKMSF